MMTDATGILSLLVGGLIGTSYLQYQSIRRLRALVAELQTRLDAQRNVLSDHHERLGLLRADINDLECAGEITRRTVVKCGQNNDRHITDFIDRVEKLEEARK